MFCASTSGFHFRPFHCGSCRSLSLRLPLFCPSDSDKNRLHSGRTRNSAPKKAQKTGPLSAHAKRSSGFPTYGQSTPTIGAQGKLPVTRRKQVCLSVCLSVCQGIIHDLHPPCQAYFPNFFARFCFHYDIIVNNASVNIIPKFDRNFN